MDEHLLWLWLRTKLRVNLERDFSNEEVKLVVILSYDGKELCRDSAVIEERDHGHS